MTIPKNLEVLNNIARRIGKKNNLTIIEVGALNCQETLSFNKLFPESHIFTFECNPATIPICREAVSKFPNIKLTEKAVTDENGTITFHPIDQEKTKTSHLDGNPGASSIFKASGKYKVETYVQKEITVDSIRLDNFVEKEKIEKIDIMWMDIQGAELKALHGLGKYIYSLDCLHTEVEFIEIYTGQPLFGDIRKYCETHDLVFICFASFGIYFGDAIFVNKKLLKGKLGFQLRMLRWSSLFKFTLHRKIKPWMKKLLFLN